MLSWVGPSKSIAVILSVRCGDGNVISTLNSKPLSAGIIAAVHDLKDTVLNCVPPTFRVPTV